WAEDFRGGGHASKAIKFHRAMIDSRRIRPLVIPVFLFLQLLGVPALGNSTTIVAVRTSTDIYIGADSRVTGVRPDGTVYYDMKCKIGQVGKIFFAGAGTFEFGAKGLNIRLVVVETEPPGARGR